MNLQRHPPLPSDATVFTPPLSPELRDRLAADLDRDGIACFEGAIDPAFLAECQEHVRGLIRDRGARYFSILDAWKEPGSVYARVVSDPSFQQLLSSLSEHGAGPKSVERAEIYNVLRIIAGDDHASRSLMFHYDATTVTALMPIFIPGGAPDQAGDLIAIPNHRPFRRSVVANLIEKMIVQNPLMRRHYARKLLGDRRTDRIYRLKPGNLYFFWGYRTLHANLPAASGALRATMLFHFGNPHEGSFATKAVLRLRRMRERKVLGRPHR